MFALKAGNLLFLRVVLWHFILLIRRIYISNDGCVNLTDRARLPYTGRGRGNATPSR